MIKFVKVFERDIDLLIINKFVNDSVLTNLFLSKINKHGYKVIDIYHSLKDGNGESDITIVLQNDDNYKIGLLIEDKIDAVAMDDQSGRYNTRGMLNIDNKLYDEFYVFIMAPKEYLDKNYEAKKYPNKISYEEIREALKEDEYAVSLLDQALEEKKNGYTIIENKNITKFWEQYYKFIRDFYPNIKIIETKGPRGNNAHWLYIKTNIKNINIIHKSDRGYLDLTFSGLAEKYEDFYDMVYQLLDEDMAIYKTGKSLVIRINIPIINFNNEFNDYIEELNLIMKNVERLIGIVTKVNVGRLYK